MEKNKTMSDDNTKVESDTSESDGKNTDNTEGNTGTDNSKQDNQEKLIPQSEVNRLVAKARDEGRRSGKDNTLKEYEGKHVLTEEDLDKIRKDAVSTALKEESLKSVRKAIQTEYGLTDAQLERISGDDDKSLRDDAELLFGALKKKTAPQLNPGNNNNTNEDSPNAEINNWLKETMKNPRKH